MAGNLSTPGSGVASRVFALLAAFDASHRSLTLSELSARAGLPLSTTHRLVGELVELGGLDRRRGSYVVGRKLWDLGLLAPVQTELRHTAAPFLQDLYAATHATVHLAERDGTEAVYLDRISGNASVPVVSRVGGRLPLFATGVGKVLLAWAPESVQHEVLGSLHRITPYTVTQPRRLVEQLERARREGYAETVEEMSRGACSLAVPIHLTATAGTDRSVVAALGVVVPDLHRARPRLVSALRVAAAGITRSARDTFDTSADPGQTSSSRGRATG